MTKQDFELIAATIRGLTTGPEPFTAKQRSQLAHRFAGALATTNPRFDRARFIAACTGKDSTDSAGRKVRYSNAA